MVLLIDNFDSFAHNLARYLTRLGLDVRVARNDAVDVNGVQRMRPQAIVLSPGPCTPDEAGCSLDLVRTFWQRYPILGICLGHQSIVAAFGGRIVRSECPMHGRTSRIWHDGSGVFAGVPSPFVAGRYHSLVADRTTMPNQLAVTATTSDGIVMSVQHRDQPVTGLQFHPESIMTECGYPILANFLRLAKLPVPETLPDRDDELQRRSIPQRPMPDLPVTF